MSGRHYLRAFTAALCLCAAAGATANQPFKRNWNPDYHCGEGIITDVIVNGWNSTGLHLEIDWAVGREPSAAALFGSGPEYSGSVRFLASDVSEEQMKAIKAAAYLAFANEYYVRVGSTYKVTGTSETNCGRATELHITRFGG